MKPEKLDQVRLNSAPIFGAAPAAARLASVDALRLVALFAIVVGHAYDKNELTDRLLQSWRLPIFFILCGYFWSARRTLAEEAGKRSRALIVPYLSWIAMIGAFAIAAFGMSADDVLRQVALGGSHADRPFTTFWFLTALFFATVTMRALDSCPGWLRWTVILGGLAANVAFGRQLALVPLSLATAFGALAFIEAGRQAHRLSLRFERQQLLLVSAAIVIGGMILIMSIPGDFHPMDMKSGAFLLLPSIFALVVGSAMVVATAQAVLPERVGHWLGNLAGPSLVVIVLHPAILMLLGGHMPYVLVTLLAFSIPLALGQVIVRTALSVPLAGVPRVDQSSTR